MSQVSIGNISLELPDSQSLELIPPHQFKNMDSMLKDLQWMMKKDSLGQDIFLYGPPGPFKRRLALTYLAMTKKESEYILIHPDTSAESDLKQRREIVIEDGVQKLKWINGPCINAVINGRCLIIEGIEKAERNVLPVLNNLLENREMTCEDATHIISSSQYDLLLKKFTKSELDNMGLIKAHENFRVIAIGNPAPPYPGNSLDPPFRSRFQARYVAPSPELLNISSRSAVEPKFLNIGSKFAKVVSAVQVSGLMKNTMLGSENLLPLFHQSSVELFTRHMMSFPLDLQSHLLQVIDNVWPASWVNKSITF